MTKLLFLCSSAKLSNDIAAAGGTCFSGSCSEVYLEKAFADDGLQPAERLPVAKELGKTSLMFLVHPTLSEKDMLQTANIVREVMQKAGK
jgi:dTDP-4-amino-4,6-dideoxygalactose transaminase